MRTPAYPSIFRTLQSRALHGARVVAAIAAGMCTVHAGADLKVDWFAVDGTLGPHAMSGGTLEVMGMAGANIAGLMVGTGAEIEVAGGFTAVLTRNEATWLGGSSGALQEGLRWDEGAAPQGYDIATFAPGLSGIINTALNDFLTLGHLRMLQRQVRIDLAGHDLWLLDDHPALPSLLVARGTPEQIAPTLTIRNQSGSERRTFFARRVVIGEDIDRIGTLRLEGHRVRVVTEGELRIGDLANGTLQVLDQSLMETTGPITVGRAESVDGAVASISTPGTLWRTSGRAGALDRFLIGASGMGTLSISSGATVETSGFDEVIFGLEPGSLGNLFIGESPSAWITDQPVIIVGAGGYAEFILDGGSILGGPALGGPADMEIGPNGWLTGRGFIERSVLNFGTVRPAGVLIIDGDFEQDSIDANGVSGRLLITLGAGINRLEVTNRAFLKGGIFIELAPGYTPGAGDPPFEFLVAGQIDSVHQRFDVALMPGIGGGAFLALGYPTSGLGGGSGVFIEVLTLDSIFGFEEFSDFDLQDLPTDIAVADFDGQNGIDIALTIPGPQGQPGHVLILFNDGTGSDFSVAMYPVGPAPVAVITADFNGDGHPDLAVANEGNGTISILLNDPAGTGNFMPAQTLVAGPGASSLTAGNFTHPISLTSAPTDLAVALTDVNIVLIFRNTGSGTFEPVPVAAIAVGNRPVSLASGDLNGNGFQEIVSANCDDNTVTIIGRSLAIPMSALATLSTGARPVHVIVPDLNNNKDLEFEFEIVTLNEEGESISILRNLGDLTFAPAVSLPIGGVPQAVTAWDMNDNGAVDLAVIVRDESNNRAVRILRNDTRPGESQITLTLADLIGKGDNPILVAHGDVSGDGADDLITINAPSGSPASGMPGAPVSSLRIRNVSLDAKTPCPADLTGDGVVNLSDLLILLTAWGNCPLPPGSPCAADLNGDSVVNISDLLILLSAWGSCSPD